MGVLSRTSEWFVDVLGDLRDAAWDSVVDLGDVLFERLEYAFMLEGDGVEQMVASIQLGLFAIGLSIITLGATVALVLLFAFTFLIGFGRTMWDGAQTAAGR